ncbi:defensin-like protein [Chenopodium quinoa]|uniref:defensin-like protein n=1 Tax=Chenopodium quinoa TaxID=63459 RepID=UPI000B770C3C|nr:defensin-like protein [Chenopodium quinoa]
MRPFTAVFLVLLLVFAAEMGPRVAEARTCETASHKFKGACISKRNCENVCQTEGFSGGDCKGLRRRCFCTKPCA